jgi:hypothetical protein
MSEARTGLGASHNQIQNQIRNPEFIYPDPEGQFILDPLCALVNDVLSEDHVFYRLLAFKKHKSCHSKTKKLPLPCNEVCIDETRHIFQ